MTNTLITHLQIFGIGLSFGFAGPCLLTCTPILMTYLAGRKARFSESIADIMTFLTGRLAAYLVLGYVAGLSGGLLNRFTNPQAAQLFKPLAGVISILLGVTILVSKDPASCECRKPSDKIYSFGSLFALGFTLGVSPCGPLAALLFEVALMSKSGVEGASYAFSFGLGTLISGLLVIGALAGLLKWLPLKILKSENAILVFKEFCSILLILLGLTLMLKIR